MAFTYDTYDTGAQGGSDNNDFGRVDEGMVDGDPNTGSGSAGGGGSDSDPISGGGSSGSSGSDSTSTSGDGGDDFGRVDEGMVDGDPNTGSGSAGGGGSDSDPISGGGSSGSSGSDSTSTSGDGGDDFGRVDEGMVDGDPNTGSGSAGGGGSDSTSTSGDGGGDFGRVDEGMVDGDPATGGSSTDPIGGAGGPSGGSPETSGESSFGRVDGTAVDGDPESGRPAGATDTRIRETVRQQAVSDSALSSDEVVITEFERTDSGVRPVVARRDQVKRKSPVEVPDAYREQIRDSAADEYDAISSEDTAVTAEDGQLGVAFSESAKDRQRRTNVADRLDERFESIDVTAADVKQTDDGQYTLDDNAVNELTQAQSQSSGQEQLGQARQEYAQRVSEQTGQDYSAEDVNVERTDDGQVQLSVERRESFDIDWSFGLGGPEDEVENTIDDAGNAFGRRASELGDTLFATDTDTENSAGAIALRAAGRDELASDYDQGVRNLGAGIFSGGAAIANVPGVAGGLMEGAETGAAAVGRTASGSGGEFVDESVERGRALGESAYDQASENPARTAGALGGSLVGSAGVISAASRTSSRAGAAARYAIQPGEELAGSLGFRATRAATSERTAQRAFPNGEPLIFSEEAAIRGGRAAADATRRAGSSTAESLRDSARAFRADTRGQMQAGSQRGRGDANADQQTDVDMGELDDLLGNMERATRNRRANQRAEERVLEQNQEAARKQEPRRDVGLDEENRYDPNDSGGLAEETRYDPDRSAVSERGTFDTSRSGPRSRQQQQMDSLVRSQYNIGRSRGAETAESSATQAEATRSTDVPMEDFRSRARSTESEVSVDTDTLGMSRASGRRVEANVDTGLESPMSRARSAQETAVSPMSTGLEGSLAGGRSRLRSETGLETGGRTDTGVDTGLETRRRTDTDLESGFESGFESSFESGFETGLETELESEFEFEFESETESRREFEGDDLRGGSDNSRSPFGGLSGSGGILERDLRNPFTGE